MINPNTGRETEPNPSYDQWKELEKVRREHGGVETPRQHDLRGALSREELVNWQGENGEIYRGMVPNRDPDLRGALSHEELVNWQGENGEVYRGMAPMNPEQAADWRKNLFGTVDVDLAEISKRARVSNYSNRASVDNALDSLIEDPDAIRNLLGYRVRTALTNIRWHNLNSEKTFTDLLFIDGALQRGMDLGDTKIDINTLAGGEEIVPISEALNRLSDYYNKTGLKITNPDDPEQTIKASDFAKHIVDEARERAQNAE